MTKQTLIHCALCGDLIKDSESHNADPICSGRCCEKCNTERVVPERIKATFGTEKTDEPSIRAGLNGKGALCEMKGSGEEIIKMTACVLECFEEKFGTTATIAMVAATLEHVQGRAKK